MYPAYRIPCAGSLIATHNQFMEEQRSDKQPTRHRDRTESGAGAAAFMKEGRQSVRKPQAGG